MLPSHEGMLFISVGLGEDSSGVQEDLSSEQDWTKVTGVVQRLQ